MWFIICTFLAFLTNCSQEKSNKTDIIVGSSFDYPPFTYIENKKFSGFEVDLIQEIARRLSFEIKFEDMNFDSLIASLYSKRIDLAIAALAKTPEREKKVEFSIPYYKSPSIAILSIDNNATSLDQLLDNQIIVQFGTAQEKLVNEKLLGRLKTPKVTALTKLGEVVQAFIADKNAVLIADKAVANEILENNPQLKVKSFVIDDSGHDFSIAFPPNSPLKSKINTCLVEMQNDGTIKQLKEKYGIS